MKEGLKMIYSANNPWILLKSDAFFNKIQFLNQALKCISTQFFQLSVYFFGTRIIVRKFAATKKNTGYGKDE